MDELFFSRRLTEQLKRISTCSLSALEAPAGYGKTTAVHQALDGQEDYWYMIKYEGIQGWVFGAEIELFEDLQKAEKWVKLTHE